MDAINYGVTQERLISRVCGAINSMLLQGDHRMYSYRFPALISKANMLAIAESYVKEGWDCSVVEDGLNGDSIEFKRK